jgi:hypothetical protein
VKAGVNQAIELLLADELADPSTIAQEAEMVEREVELAQRKGSIITSVLEEIELRLSAEIGGQSKVIVTSLRDALGDVIERVGLGARPWIPSDSEVSEAQERLLAKTG